MHILNKILVRIPSIYGYEDLMSRKQKISEIRSYAEEQTTDYADLVYDWRECETAGRWSDEYPENVLLAGEDLDRFLQELKDVQTKQATDADDYLDAVQKYAGSSNLTEMVSAFKANATAVAPYGYQVKMLGSLLAGTYTAASGYLDTCRWSAIVHPETIEDIKAKPEDWALVLFDHHF